MRTKKEISAMARPILSLLCFLLLTAPTLWAEDAVKAQLIASSDAFVPGQSMQVGLQLEMAEGWYVYWEYPGDAGTPPSVDWDLPEGITVSEIDWPVPKRKELGGLVSYVYGEKIILPMTLKIADSVETGQTINLFANVRWLACKEVCVPGETDLQLTLPVRNSAEKTHTEAFEATQQILPQSLPAGVTVEQKPGEEARLYSVAGAPAQWSQLDFFPNPGQYEALGVARVDRVSESEWKIEQPLGEKRSPQDPLNGLLVVEEGDERIGYRISDAKEKAAIAPDKPSADSAGSSPLPLLFQLGLAFLGGLLLNIMPCVLPVLSLKVLHFTQQAGEDRRRIFQFGLAFAAGIFAWFMGLGVVSAIAKAGGGDVFWGNIFQIPAFTFTLAAVAFVFALSLLGVFEMVLPGSLTTKLAGASGEGYAGAFASGFFATVMGSACTAPMLGPAIGWAFFQSPLIILLIFFAIALGMSSPYLILTAQPAWMKWLPRPGAWMETFKQLMGFLLMPVVIWLVWVLGQQKGAGAMGWALTGLLGLALFTWTIGRLQMSRGNPKWRATGFATAALVTVALVGFGWNGIARSEKVEGTSQKGLPNLTAEDWKDSIPWIAYSPEMVEAALATDRVVFLDFTADWCLSCKWNESTVLNTDKVREAMAAVDLLPIKIDWTDQNPEIGKKIQSFGRAGVPLYVLYPADRSRDPEVLPEFLTQGIMLEALRGLQGSREDAAKSAATGPGQGEESG